MSRTACVVLVFLTAATGASAQEASPVSAERIGNALKRPELEIPPITLSDVPTFKVKVRGDWPIETNLEFVRREMAEEAGTYHRIVPGVGTTPPLVAVDVLPAIMSGIKHIRDVRYAHAVANARERVEEDFAAFCAENDCEVAPAPAAEGIITP